MITGQQFIYKLTPKFLNEEQVYGALGHFPKETVAVSKDVTDLDKTKLDDFEGMTELVVLLDHSNPKSILEHEILGPIIKPHERAVFDGDRLIQDSVMIGVPGKGSLKRIHLTVGTNLDPNSDMSSAEDMEDPHAVNKVRNDIANKVGAAIKRVSDEYVEADDESKPQLGFFIGDQIVSHENSKDFFRALGRSIGNIREYTDLYSSDPDEIMVDGVHPLKAKVKKQLNEKIKERDNIKDDIADLRRKLQASHHSVKDETGTSKLSKALKTRIKERDEANIKLRGKRKIVRRVEKGIKGEKPLNEILEEIIGFGYDDKEERITELRREMGDVLLFSDNGVLDEELLQAYMHGDMVSRMQLLTKKLAECPYSIMKCKVLMKLIVMHALEIQKMGNNIQIEIVGPTNAILDDIDEDLYSGPNKVINFKSFADIERVTGIKMGGINSVHSGTSQEMDPGPITVVVKIDNTEDGDESDWNVLVGKGVVKDTGGYDMKKGMLPEMDGDMGGAAALLAIQQRVGIEKVKKKLACIYGIGSNNMGPEATIPGHIIQLASGRTLMVLNTDAEGRLILMDIMSYALFTLDRDGETFSALGDICTLTGAAAIYNQDETTAITPNKKLGRNLEDFAESIGERVTFDRVKAQDHKGAHPNPAQLGVNAVNHAKTRGITTPAAQVIRGAGLSRGAANNFVQWDIADALGLFGKKVIPADVQGRFHMEIAYETIYQWFIGSITAKDRAISV